MSANALELEVDKIIRHENIAGQKVSIGLSGGCDSVCLLKVFVNLASRYEIDLTAVHVNHCISKKSDEWEVFCRDLSKSLQVGFQSEKVSVDLRSGHGLEEAARDCRYSIFSKLPVDFIFLAHHLDDQIETFFLQLFRGAGVSGLAAMPQIRTPWGEKGPKIVRPWLFIERKSIFDYAVQENLNWIEDESNHDQSLDRNFLRASVLPEISKRYPGYRDCIRRTIQNSADTDSLSRDLAEIDKKSIMDGQRGINLDRLGMLKTRRIINLLRLLFFEKGLRYPRRNLIKEIVRQLFEAKQDAQINFEINGIYLRRYRNRLYFSSSKLIKFARYRKEWLGEERIFLPGEQSFLSFNKSHGVGLDLRKIHNKVLTIEFRKGGEKMIFGGGKIKKSLKNLFQQAGIPPWVRTTTPLVFCDGDLVWIPNVGYSRSLLSKDYDLSLVIQWQSVVALQDDILDYRHNLEGY